MAKNVHQLADLIGDTLELRCNRRGRHGRLSVARLAPEYAPDTSLPTIMWAQIGDCLNRNAQRDRKRCDPHSPTLMSLSARPRIANEN
jgi:hypothetical protein